MSRLGDLADFRATRAAAAFATFATVMRLAPTGVPALGGAAEHFAAGEPAELLTQYANLPDPPQTAEQRALAARLAQQLGPLLDAYLGTRARNRSVDLFALRLTAEGRFDRIVLGQDDAGPVGLHAGSRRCAVSPAVDRAGVASARADELAIFSLAPSAPAAGSRRARALFARRRRSIPRSAGVRTDRDHHRRHHRACGALVEDARRFFVRVPEPHPATSVRS